MSVLNKGIFNYFRTYLLVLHKTTASMAMMTVVTTSSSISTASGAKVGNIAIASGLAVVS